MFDKFFDRLNGGVRRCCHGEKPMAQWLHFADVLDDENNNENGHVNVKPLWGFSVSTFVLAFVFTLTGCSDAWDEHFSPSGLSSTDVVEVYDDDVASFVASQSSLSKMKTIWQQASLKGCMQQGSFCTLLACEDSHITASDAEAMQHPLFAANTLSVTSTSPSMLTDGRGVWMLSGKNVWVTDAEDGLRLGGRRIVRQVKATNGYIYFLDGILPVQPSVYEYIQSLGDDYSLFKSLLAEFEERYFDADASTPSGVDAMGNVTYSDSVFAVRNTLMDRFTEDGLDSWNMRSESHQSTLFVPSNELILKAYHSALDSVPYWMNRSVTAADSLKFRRWMVESCFVDRRLSSADVASNAEGQFQCVGGCVRQFDETIDKLTFIPIDAAWWKPSVQHVDAAHPVQLSNGVAYLLTDYKIPNHIVIWRVKARFYQVWAALNAVQQGWDGNTGKATSEGYFRWHHWVEPLIVNEAQSPFELSATLPTMYYHVLTAIPDSVARHEGLPVSVDYDGLMYNADEPRTFGLSEVHLPAGEYYLRMGFKHSLTYSISIYFCGADEEFSDANRLVTDMSLVATGSNFHFDRGGAMEGLDFNGSESIGYPEGYDWRWWYNQDPVLYQKASAYDTDGYQVAVVNLPKPGNFKIRIESNDVADLYREAYGDDFSTGIRNKNNVQQLMMYHWCLRPTVNNY